MPKTDKKQQHPNGDLPVPDAESSALKEQIIAALGKPANLLKVVARPLWQRCFRVNVFVGENAATAKIANSYFVEADPAGNILESNPKITKQY
jgi:hypothetical protein